MSFLREEMLWSNDDALFPATRVALGISRQFEAVGLNRVRWSNASASALSFATPSLALSLRSGPVGRASSGAFT